MGMLPMYGPGYGPADVGLDSYAMLDAARGAKLDVLSLFGVNPARNAQDPKTAREALDMVPFLVVSELFMTETAERATLVLPAKGAFEKYGTVTNLAGDLLPVNPALQAPEFVYSDLDMLCGLADQLDVSIPSGEDLDRVVVAAVAKLPRDFTLGDARFGDRGTAPPERSWRDILSGGGTWLHDPWLTGLRAEVS